MESLSSKLFWRSNKVNELFEGLGRNSKRYRSKRSRLMDFEHEVSVMSDRSKPPNLEDWIYTKWQAVRIKWQAKCILTFSHCFLIILLSSIAIIIIDLDCNTLCDYTLHFFLMLIVNMVITKKRNVSGFTNYSLKKHDDL